jgi:hypothetical protein
MVDVTPKSCQTMYPKMTDSTCHPISRRDLIIVSPRERICVLIPLVFFMVLYISYMIGNHLSVCLVVCFFSCFISRRPISLLDSYRSPFRHSGCLHSMMRQILLTRMSRLRHDPIMWLISTLRRILLKRESVCGRSIVISCQLSGFYTCSHIR